MFEKIGLYETYGSINGLIRRGISTAVFGVQSGEKLFIADILDAPLKLYVARDYLEARRIAGNIEGSEYLPFRDDVLLYKRSASKQRTAERNRVLYLAATGRLSVVVASIDALTQRFPEKEVFLNCCFSIEAGESYNVKELVSRLVKAGYERCPLVAVKGEFSLRGDILDIFSPLYEKPVRISFFDDIAETVRFFDSDTHKSQEEIESFTIIPVKELFEGEEGKAFALAKKEALKMKQKPDAAVRTAAIFSELEAFGDSEWLAPYAEYSRLTDYLPEDGLVIWDEPKMLADRVERLYDEHFLRCEYLIERGELLSSGVNMLVDKADVTCVKGRQIAFQMLTAQSFFKVGEAVFLSSSQVPKYGSDSGRLAQDIKGWLANGYGVAVFAGSNADAQRLQSELYSQKCVLPIRERLTGSLVNGAIISQRFDEGFVSHTAKLVLVGTDRIFSTASNAAKGRLRKTTKQAFLAVEAGDYVVHETHGIGLCIGTTVIKGDFGEKDYIVVRYRNNDTLYVPVEASDLLTKYGGGDREPRLSALGGGEFERTKAKVKSKLKEMAIDLVELYSQRMRPRGFSYKKDDFLTESFAEAFPYRETEDQLKAIEEISKDLHGNRIMDRLLVGDVGFGKTEVAMRAIFDVVANGFQAIVMAPTTILSQQHYELMKERFAPFDLNVVCLNRFRSKAEQNEIIKSIAAGRADIVVGTHRLLSKEIVYKNPGILVLDEEHRFGVEHKELLKTVKNNIDVLSMSATPIPRTLHMALSGIRDISTITTPPKERLPVESFVVEDSPALIRDVIIREKSREGQVFIVYNRVESIDVFSMKIRELVPEVRVCVAHGQMKESELEKTIYDFSKHEYDVLISTTIIENGIDIPNANTLIVYDADKLGLSQLYQLRGRVGRSNRLAFAYFIYRSKVLSDEAYKRLTSIMENTELGSGFKIAMKDLEIRGAGNVLGKEQHGHMEKVGLETYTQLLNEVVAEVRGEPLVKEIKTSMEVEVNAHVPDEYIPDHSHRMDFYQRMASVSGKADRKNLEEELRDVYGAIPKPVSNLLDLAELKAIAAKVGVSDVIIKKGNAALAFDSPKELVREGIQYALKLFGKTVQITATGEAVMAKFIFKGKSERYLLTALKAFCETAYAKETDSGSDVLS